MDETAASSGERKTASSWINVNLLLTTAIVSLVSSYLGSYRASGVQDERQMRQGKDIDVLVSDVRELRVSLQAHAAKRAHEGTELMVQDLERRMDRNERMLERFRERASIGEAIGRTR